mmetsp:Transcript_80181/g.201758  ORF Transcript_80181/g.201758 Transcript_80181/m.201758 type:complete len:81 (+) Transcript_80181:335-577(+)
MTAKGPVWPACPATAAAESGAAEGASGHGPAAPCDETVGTASAGLGLAGSASGRKRNGRAELVRAVDPEPWVGGDGQSPE